jgi:MYXO-CTERM domain-containing protein
VKHALGSRFALSVVLVGCALAAPAPALAVNATLWVPEGVSKLRGIIACTSVGLGSGWCKSADFQALAKKLEVGVVSLSGENAFASYANRCTGGEFKALLDKLTEVGKAANHPELANAPIVGMGHSHGGDYWNYFNACFPQRMALIFDKSSGGVQYTGAALKTPMVWEVGTNDLKNSMGHFRADMMAHRTKGTAMALVLGPGETHGSLTAGPRAMVIDLIEAFFNLRVPREADPSAGPVTLNVIDESTGAYWLGDNYTKEIGAWSTFPGKATPWKTSFLPTEELANKWKMAGTNLPTSITVAEGGVCTTCYAHPASEPAWNPSANPPGGSTPPPAADAGVPADAEAPVVTPPPAEPDAGSSTPTPPPAARADAAPSSSPEPTDDPPPPTGGEARSSGGCSVGGAPAGSMLAVGLLALGLVVARRRRR